MEFQNLAKFNMKQKTMYLMVPPCTTLLLHHAQNCEAQYKNLDTSKTDHCLCFCIISDTSGFAAAILDKVKHESGQFYSNCGLRVANRLFLQTQNGFT